MYLRSVGSEGEACQGVPAMGIVLRTVPSFWVFFFLKHILIHLIFTIVCLFVLRETEGVHVWEGEEEG